MLDASLTVRMAALRAAEPGLYPRDQAARLGISECELLAISEGRGATRLQPGFAPILAALPRLGPVSAVTRNADAVHEIVGIYGEHEGGVQPVLDRWKHGWAVQAPAGRRSLQFFGGDGAAYHKVFATERTDLEAWIGLVAGHTAAGPAEAFGSAPADACPDGGREVRPVATGAFRQVLTEAATGGLPVTICVANPGCVQAYTGPVRTLFETGPWFHVDDPGFKLHVREPAIASARLVEGDGAVTSLELLDASGAVILGLAGAALVDELR